MKVMDLFMDRWIKVMVLEFVVTGLDLSQGLGFVVTGLDLS
jgi:hypothetical protein